MSTISTDSFCATLRDTFKLMMNFYLIPGFGETTNDPGYHDVVKFAEKKGFRVITHNPDWDKNPDFWIKEMSEILNRDNSEKQILGFSMGAYITALCAKDHQFTKIFFCSLSPYFKSDIEHLPKLAFEVFGDKRMEIFSNYSFPEKIAVPAVFIVGDKDIPIVVERSRKSHGVWAGEKKLVIIPGVGHDISEKKYTETLEGIM